MEENKHISQVDLFTFKHNLMNPQEMKLFLEHISSCLYCSEQFADCMVDETITAPMDLKANILKATRRPNIQITTKIKETSKRMQLLLYSLKVGTATIGALILLLLTINSSNHSTVWDSQKDIPTNEKNTVSLTSTIRKNVNHLNNNILDFSNTIMKTEVNEYDQKEK